MKVLVIIVSKTHNFEKLKVRAFSSCNFNSKSNYLVKITLPTDFLKHLLIKGVNFSEKREIITK